MCYTIIVVWLVGQAVKTPASHAGNAGSIPARVTIYLIFRYENQVFFFADNCILSLLTYYVTYGIINTIEE